MDELISNQFRAALLHLLTQEGRGAQARLSKRQSIDRGYLNAIVKGRKPGSDSIRGKIADHFNMAYEDMFVLGRRVLAQTDDVVAFKVLAEEEGGAPSIQTQIMKTIEILESDSKYSDLLAGLIDSFHDSLNTERAKETMH